MKLTEMFTMPMQDVVRGCDVIDQKIHTDDDGNIKTIEVKYRPIDNKVGKYEYDGRH